MIQVRPESGAVVPRWDGPAVIRFDEVIEEMPDQLARHVLLSPVRGPVAVSWHRTRIEVEPKEGWKPGRVYRLELLAGITDLRRNRLDSGRTVIFSTGPALPGARLQGTALHWTEQRALGRALIQAALRPDTVPYLALADSSGAFTLSGIPPGDYLVYAVHDQNTNRQRDPREAYDSALVRVDSTAMVVLWAFVHDTTAPRLKAAEAVDSVSVRVEFTQYLDPERPVDPAQVRLVALPDSTPVRLAAVLTPRAFDSVRARERAAADSARRAERDTAAAGRREPRREA
ncbi:MAG TPA: Ig-like domain-containing protein, partial [Gemmatimonadales bacterium]|nr:Ig-like domain-containing protein [Gemmatimonadales bacterium]